MFENPETLQRIQENFLEEVTTLETTKLALLVSGCLSPGDSSVLLVNKMEENQAGTEFTGYLFAISSLDADPELLLAFKHFLIIRDLIKQKNQTEEESGSIQLSNELN